MRRGKYFGKSESKKTLKAHGFKSCQAELMLIEKENASVWTRTSFLTRPKASQIWHTSQIFVFQPKYFRNQQTISEPETFESLSFFIMHSMIKVNKNWLLHDMRNYVWYH